MLNRDDDSISSQLASLGITWKLNPPFGPHFGGIFESGIKSTKYHLKRVNESQILTFEEFYTILTKISGHVKLLTLSRIIFRSGEIDALTLSPN